MIGASWVVWALRLSRNGEIPVTYRNTGANSFTSARYEAIRTWNRLLKSADSEYWVQLSPGTAVVVDNHRVLHGRSSFDGKRRMCGAYIGFDEYRSKLAILKGRFDPDRVTVETRDPSSGESVWGPAL